MEIKCEGLNFPPLYFQIKKKSKNLILKSFSEVISLPPKASLSPTVLQPFPVSISRNLSTNNSFSVRLSAPYWLLPYGSLPLGKVFFPFILVILKLLHILRITWRTC